ncbi:MAG: TadE/TadG family type IV pilus assembly protein [Terriglobales bacterium]
MQRATHSRGQALAEFAIVLPLLLLVLVGVEECGRLAYTAIVADHAAYAGALYGAQNSATVVDSAAMVHAALEDGADLSSLTASATHVCTCSDGGAAPGCALADCPGTSLRVYAQVATTATFTPVCNLFGWPGSLTLHGQAAIEARP